MPELRQTREPRATRLRIHLGLGSNLGTRWSHLARALDALRRIDEALVISHVYETVPLGGPEQGPFLNCVAQLVATMSPHEVLELAQGLEREAGRIREVHWGPRTLDVDVLVLEDESSATTTRTAIVVVADDLVVPHPRLAERAFVLAPLEEVAPELVDVCWRERLGGRSAVEGAVRCVGDIVVGAL